jgi:hypothetical protein
VNIRSDALIERKKVVSVEGYKSGETCDLGRATMSQKQVHQFGDTCQDSAGVDS